MSKDKEKKSKNTPHINDGNVSSPDVKQDSANDLVEEPQNDPPKGIAGAIRELVDPFKSLGRTSRSLWGIYIAYILEGMVYFGILTILGKFLSENVGLSDLHAGWVYSLFTGGITLAMLFLGGIADKIGVRKALLVSLLVMIVGRFFLAMSGTVFPHNQGAASPMFFTILAGLAFVVVGYGMYQPASYAGVKQFTDEKGATMAYAMIYGLMNLGAFFSGILSPRVRQASGIVSVYWVYVVFTALAFLSILFFISKRAVKRDTLTELNVKKEEKVQDIKTEEKGEETPQKLITPAFLVMVVGVTLAVATLIYLSITADPGPSAKQLDNVAKAYGGVSAALQETKKPVDFKAKLDAIKSAVAQITPPKAVPSGTKIDQNTYALIKYQANAETELIKSFLPLLKFRDTTFDTRTPVAKSSYAVLRALGVHYMASAYSLVGKMNSKVLLRIQQRQSLPSESKIPIDDEYSKIILKSVELSTHEMLLSLAATLDERSNVLKTDLGDAVSSLPLILSHEANVLRKTADLCKSGVPAGVRPMLVQKFYNVGNFLIRNVAPKLIDPEKKPQKLIISIMNARLSSSIQYIGDMKSAAAAAVQVPTSKKLMDWFMRYGILMLIMVVFIALILMSLLNKRPDHPFHNGRFVFFIFILIPVQTLFAHNWLTLPYYIDRAFGGTYVGNNFEFFANINPILIFFLTPFVAALTSKAKVYNMMVYGTLIMAIPTFLLVLPPSPVMLLTYILLMSIGEAMWQPRFLQWVAEIAPEGKTGAYMGIAQFPWFLTKVVTGLYSGYFLSKYCPLVGPQNTEFMWLIYAVMAMVTPFALMLAKGWMAKGMAKMEKTKNA